MPSEYKILGQIAPTQGTITNVYVTNTTTSAIVSTITISSLQDANASYSLIVRPINESLDQKHFIIRGGVVPGREVITITGAVTLNSNAILAANTTSSNLVFHAYGAEIT